MRAIDSVEFLAWAAKLGIEPDERWQGPKLLHFSGVERPLALVHALPPEYAPRRRIIVNCLRGMGNGSKYLWRRGGEWVAHSRVPKAAGETVPPDFTAGVYDIFIRLGIPMQSVTLEFNEQSVDLLAVLLFLNSIIAWKVPDDLVLVGEDADVIATFNHDDEISLSFASHEARRVYRERSGL